MNAIYGLLLLLGSTLALAQGASPSSDIGSPGSFGVKGTCIASCEKVFSDCTVQCENADARARERHYETPDLPVGACINVCRKDLRFCKEDC